jgi:hypothetical protein
VSLVLRVVCTSVMLSVAAGHAVSSVLVSKFSMVCGDSKGKHVL